MKHLLTVTMAGLLLSGCYGYGELKSVDAAGNPLEGTYDFVATDSLSTLQVFIGRDVYCEGDYKTVFGTTQRLFLNCTTQPLASDTNAIQSLDFVMTGHAVQRAEGSNAYDIEMETLSYDGIYKPNEYFKGYVVMADIGDDAELGAVYEGGIKKLTEQYYALLAAYPRGPLPQ